MLSLENNVPPNRYWVSAMSIGCPSVHRWCNLGDNPLMEQHERIVWKKGEPSSDPLKECVAVDFQHDPPYMTFVKVDCNSLLLNFFREHLKKMLLDILMCTFTFKVSYINTIFQ